MPVDMSPEASSQRLRAASQLSDLTLTNRFRASVDVSPEGIAARLNEVADLNEACLELAALGRAFAGR